MVTFFLPNKKRATSSISILVTFRGKKYRRSIGESVPVDLWNNDKKRVRVSTKYPQGNITNDMLMKWEAAALRTISHFKEYCNPPEDDLFFNFLDKEFYKDETVSEQKVVNFLDYLQIYIERYQNVRDYKTIQKYITARNKLAEYEKRKRKKLTFSDITIDFYNDFRFWFYLMGLSDNYFGSVIKFVKQAYSEARIVDRLHSMDGIQHKDFITVNADSDSVYLNEDELQKIYNLSITPEYVQTHFPNLTPRRSQQKYESLLIVRDRFLIGAYTGLRVSDFSRLGEMNIGEHIRIVTDKGKTSVVIPLHPIVKEITSRIDLKITISDQKMNKHIKELARMAGITEMVLLNKHVAGKVEQKCVEKCDAVTTHTARRSFATNAYKAGVPTISIMKITGHKKESSFMKYIKVTAEENADRLKTHPFFASGKKNAEPNAEPKSCNE